MVRHELMQLAQPRGPDGTQSPVNPDLRDEDPFDLDVRIAVRTGNPVGDIPRAGSESEWGTCRPSGRCC